MARKYLWFVIVLLLALILDQGSKAWARHALQPVYPNVVSVIPGYFDLRYSENPGAAFGLFRNLPGARYLHFLIGVGALVIVANILRKARADASRLGVELGLLAGGALGNFIDRVRFGHVTDFIVWRVGMHEWPTFNIADAALVLGVAGLILDREFSQRQKKSEAKKA